MITRIVKMNIRESEVEKFKELIKPIQDKIREVDGCMSVNILCDKSIPTKFFSYSIWLSEKHLARYKKSELFKTTWAEAKKLFSTHAQVWTVQDAFKGGD